MRTFDRLRTPAGTVGVIDVGTAKVCCLIVAPDAEGGLELLGFGHQRSQGVKAGVIVASDAAESAVRAAVAQAERGAGIALERVVVAVACGRLQSSTFVARADVAGAVVGSADIDRVIAGGEAYVDRGGRGIVQLTRSDWRLDHVKGVRDPRGLAGRELSVELTAVTADEAPVRNLISVIERCHLTVGGLAATPFASAVAVAAPEERRGQVLVVDIGAGTTTLAVFADGRLVLVDAIPVGGNHLTFDIARDLAMPVAEAERIKTLYGTLIKAPSDAADTFSYLGVGEDGAALHQASKARLRQIIEPRIDMLVGLVADRLSSAGLADAGAARTVLTGGGSQLVGLEQVWAARFGSVVRIGKPKQIGRMPGRVASPAFAAVIGLALGEASSGARRVEQRHTGRAVSGYFGRVRKWVGESF